MRNVSLKFPTLNQKERFGLSSLLGAILVLAGILLSNRMRMKEAAQSA